MARNSESSEDNSMKAFSKFWNTSKNPKKQRKYRANAPIHIKGKYLTVHLDSKKKKKYFCRNLRVRIGDKVKILRGNFKGQEVKVDSLNVNKAKVYSSKITITKKDNSTTQIPLEPSNLLLVNLNLEDKKRLKILERKK
jgi:large subunit ribosomal protein L24